jgi:uncharacterized protein (DUF362 family)
MMTAEDRMLRFSRRNFFQTSTGALVASATCWPAPETSELPQPIAPLSRRSRVSLVRGENRRHNVYEALKAIDDELAPALKKKKYVVIKPNNVVATNPLASTNVDALRGILDYVTTRFKGPVVIAESSAGETLQAFENFQYNRLAGEYKSRKINLVDLNQEAKYELLPILDSNLHLTPVRLAARLLDPDAFVISSAMLKTHNTVVATLGIKNMALGAPLHQAPGDKQRWSDKRKYHGGVRQTHYDILLTAQRLKPTLGLSVIDGFEGMEGNGPGSGTAVSSRVAIASTDFIAADRIGLEAMSIDPSWPGYLVYCHQAGLGQYDLKQIDIAGESLAAVRKQYRLHDDIKRELLWQGPMTELPPKLG